MTEKQPFNVICSICGAIWTAAYTPMPLVTFAAVLRDCHCPYCASTSDKHYNTKDSPGGPSVERVYALETK